MEQSYDYQSTIAKLYTLYVEKGFLREKEALELMAIDNVSLVGINRITDKLLVMGVLFVDDDFGDEDDESDRTLTDYITVFKEVLEISPNQEFLLDYIRNVRPPQHREWQLLVPQMNSGNDYAFKRLFDMYLRIVVKIALRFYKINGLELEDAIQEGAMGLIRAMRQFDGGKHRNFSSYLSLWIQQYISRADADTGRTIRIPVHMLETLKQFQNASYELEQQSGHSPTIDEIATQLEIERHGAEIIKNYSLADGSLETLLEEDELCFSDKGVWEEKIFNQCINDELSNLLSSALSTLPSRESGVLKFRYGLVGKEPLTLDNIGTIYNLSKERIRQIEEKAIKRLCRRCVTELFAFYD